MGEKKRMCVQRGEDESLFPLLYREMREFGVLFITSSKLTSDNNANG